MELNSNTFSTFLSDLKDVKVSIYLKGSVVLFNTLILRQELNSCHTFEFTQDFLGKEDLVSQIPPQSLTNSVGERIHILFEHASDTYEFIGFITEVVSNFWENASGKPNANYLCYKGKGAICLLDGAPSMFSFTDSTLFDIVENLTSDCSKYFTTHCNPKFEGILPFALQYKESIFSFLNRLSAIYNELFFYDGKALVFGDPPSINQEKLTFDEDIISFRTSTQTLAHSFSYCDYFAERDTFLTSQKAITPKRQNTIFTPLLERYDDLYLGNSMNISPAVTCTPGDLDNVLQGNYDATLGRMHIIEGKTKTSRVKIGGLIRIHFSEHYNLGREIGVYRVVSVTHQVARDGGYVNHFMAVPEGLEFCLFNPETIAYPEVAKVVDNNDPEGQGRVQVQFYWQEQKGLKTNWLRVQSSDAGVLSNGVTNRGVMFIPEKGDQVMVSFEQGNPHRPYVSGSMFHGGNTSGASNNVRSITTKSGCKIVFDDNDESILVEDPSGNKFFMDGSGNIEVNAPKNMTLTVGEDFTLNIGKNMNTTIGNNNTISVGNDNILLVENNHSLEATNYGQTLKENYNQNVRGNKEVSITGNLKETSGAYYHTAQNGDVIIQSSNISKLLGKVDAKVNKG